MITEDYVSFEIATLLKGKSFEGEVSGYYHIWDSRHPVWGVETYNCSEAKHLYIPAPTLQMAMKWLREEHNIEICTEPHSYSATEGKTSNYEFSYWKGDNYVAPYSQKGHELSGKTWEKYEDACEAAIKYCIENLI